MQIRADNDIFAQYGTPSRPISPSTLSTSLKKTSAAGNEPAEIDHQSAESQAGRESPPQQQRSATSPSQFPPELIDHIVDHLHDDKESLVQCSLTSRVFAHATSYHLFRSVRIPSARHCVRFQELISSSLHPLSSTSNQHTAPSLSLTPSSSSPPPHAAHNHITQAHSRSTHLHPHSDLTSTQSHARPTCVSICDVPSAGWDISKFVRKIEFQCPPSSIEEYVSEAVKLVRMLPRIREVIFMWWTRSADVERIARAFAPTSYNTSNPPNQTLSPSALSEMRTGQASTNDPLKVHLDMVDFESIHTFLDFLECFGGRLRELSLSNVCFEGNGGNGKGDFRDRCLPGIECVYLGYEGEQFGSLESSFSLPFH